jgi:hypothetical protein
MNVKHPRTLRLFRAALVVVTTVAVVGVLGVGLSVLGAVVVLAGVSLVLTGDPNVVGFALLAVVGVLATGGLALGIRGAARRIDRRVTAWDRRPDPLDELRRAYVAGEIDETTLERRVERLLAPDDEPDSRRRGHRERVSGAVSGLPVLGDRVRATEGREQERELEPKLT